VSEKSEKNSSLEASLDGRDNQHDSSMRALIIDDSQSGRRIIQALLSVLGFEVVEADGPKEALAALDHHKFALITVDRILGDFDGVELVQQLRQNPKCGDEPRILAVTGNVGREHREAFFKAGADAFLNKPFNVKELSEMLQALGFSVHN
jgi:CheY-like chemotaxis protein